MDKKPKISIWEYFQSERYHQMTEESLILEKRLLEYAREYRNNQTVLGQRPKRRKEIVTWGYAVGGEYIDRGPLCPGHMESLLCGNVKRGRLVKRSKKPSFTYGYDENGELCSCINPYLDGEHEEHIVRKGNLEVGVKPHGEEGMVDVDYGVVEVVCDDVGRVKTYLSGFVDIIMYGELKVTQYFWESYQYNADNTVNVEFRDVMCENEFTTRSNINCQHVVLYLDKERKVEKYSVCEDICPDNIGFYNADYEWVIPE